MADGGLPSGAGPRRLNLVVPEMDRQAAAIAAEQARLARERAAQVAAEMAERMRRPPAGAGLADAVPTPPPAAGLVEPPARPVPAAPRPGPTVAATVDRAIPDAPALPGPRISPTGKISSRDIYAAGGNELSVWDRVFNRPEYQAARAEVPKIRAAEAWEKDRPAVVKARGAEAAAEAERLRLESDADIAAAQALPPGKAKNEALKAATKKAENAEDLLNKTGRANLDDEIAAPAAKARADAAEAVRNAREGRLARRAAKVKGALRTGGVGLAAAGLGAAATAAAVYAWRNSKDDERGLIERYVGGDGLTIHEEMRLKGMYDPETFGALTEARNTGVSLSDIKAQASEDEALEGAGVDPAIIDAQVEQEDLEARAATGDPESAAVLPFMSGRIPQPMPDFDFGGDPETQPMAIDYRKPEIPAVPQMDDPIDQTMANIDAMYGAGVENTASAAGAPDGVINMLRQIEAQNRGEPVGEVIPDNMLKRGFDAASDFYNSTVRPGMEYYRGINEDVNDPVLNGAWDGGMFLGDMVFGQGADEQAVALAGLPVNAGRDAYRVAVPTGVADYLAPGYREWLRSMGGETLLLDPLSEPSQPMAGDMERFDREREAFDREQPRESNSGVNGQAMMTLDELRVLEQDGRLGVKPDGTPYTADEMMRVMTGSNGDFAPPPDQPLPPPPEANKRQFGADFRSLLGMGPGPWEENLSNLTPEEMESLRLNGRLAPGNSTGQPVAPPRPMQGPPMPEGAGLEPAPIVPPARQRTIAEELGIGPVEASEPPRDDEVNEAVRSLADQDETQNPRGQAKPRARPEDAGPQMGRGLDETWSFGEPAPPSATPAAGSRVQPVIASPTGTTAQMAAASGGQSGGSVGDFRSSREAGLSDDAAAAEEELNWINRQMRDKLGLDATARGYLSQALIAGGAAMMSSDDDFLGALGDGLLAGAGAIGQAKEADAKAAMDQFDMKVKQANESRDAALDAVRLRVEQARLARGGSGSDYDIPAKQREIDLEADFIYRSTPGITYDEARKQAAQMVYNRTYEEFEA